LRKNAAIWRRRRRWGKGCGEGLYFTRDKIATNTIGIYGDVIREVEGK